MKKMRMLAVLSAAALAVTPLALAQDGGAARPGAGVGRGGGQGGQGGQGGAQMQERMKEAWAAVDKQACFKAMDTNADGNVSKEEFEAADLQAVFGNALREAMTKQRAGAGAGGAAGEGGPAQWDKNGDGKVTADEFPRGEEAFKKLLERADKDGDGALSTEEMKAAREGMQQQQRQQERKGQK
jgi:Ca2+-binding EF-hand superfamily protein